MKYRLATLGGLVGTCIFVAGSLVSTAPVRDTGGAFASAVAQTYAFTDLGATVKDADGPYSQGPPHTTTSAVTPSNNLERIFTFAGTGIPATSGDGGPPSAASFTRIGVGIAKGPDDSVYIADEHRVRKITTSSGAMLISTIAGTGEAGFSGDGGPASAARLNSPQGLAVDAAGNLYISDAVNLRIRRVDASSGIITTIAGTGIAGYSGDFGPASSARFREMFDLAIDSMNRLYVSDYVNSVVRRIDLSTELITTVAGSSKGFSGDGGPATQAQLDNLLGISVDASNNLYIVANKRIRMVSNTSGIINTIAGNGNFSGGTGDGGPALQAGISAVDVAVDSDGNVLVTDQVGPIGRIRRVDRSTGAISTIVGVSSIEAVASGFGISGGNGDGEAAIYGRVLQPYGLALDSTGRLLITDGAVRTVRVVTSTTDTTRRLAASPLVIRIGAVRSSGSITTTAPVPVTIATFGSASMSWSVQTGTSWLRVDQPSGSGVGNTRVSVDFAGNVPSATSIDGTLEVSSPGAVNSPLIVHVRVTFIAQAASEPPFGQLDTPLQNAVGIVGAIPVTGWALDDTGVTGVRLYRNCLPIENQVNCQMLDGRNLVYIGDAVFVSGARPDVETIFWQQPQASRAGWGYLMLTNMLPRVSDGGSHGGQGTITLYAVATDSEGNRTFLGRSRLDFVPTTITLANDSIAKPFGAIDTPSQGGLVSGTAYGNYGWVLSPDVVVPIDGSTMRVFIDGAVAGNVTYNQCRGNVGNPVPSGQFCNDDVANIFGNTTPQPTFTPRTSNPSRYPNLDVARGPQGGFFIDSTRLTNGMHSIAWSVTDSGGRTEGIGSRSFSVLNGSSDLALPRSAPSLALPAETLDDLGLATTGLWGRTGFDLSAAWVEPSINDSGTYRIRIPELGRAELWFGQRPDTGYLVANGTLRPLPVGSRLADSHFTWAPPAGFLGTYRLAFLTGMERTEVEITIATPTPSVEGEAEIRMHLDDVQQSSSTVHVQGWAFDPQAGIGTGIGFVHVWSRRLDLTGLKAGEVDGMQPPVFLGSAELNVARPDVARAFRGASGRSGFALNTSVEPGTYEITAYVWNVRTARWEDARSVVIIVR